MTVKSAEITPEKVSGNLCCESCGKEFACGAKTGNCWCFAVAVDAEVLIDLREKFENCLCSDCLKLLSQDEP